MHDLKTFQRVYTRGHDEKKLQYIYIVIIRLDIYEKENMLLMYSPRPNGFEGAGM
jgi:hypothetical protein